MNFTKEYIELCENNKIQRLKKKLEYGDWVFYDMPSEFLEDGLIQITNPIAEFNSKIFTWLPTGDQLDQFIINICEKKQLYYDFVYCYNEPYTKIYISAFAPLGSISGGFEVEIREKADINLAKLRLLIALLKEK